MSPPPSLQAERPLEASPLERLIGVGVEPVPEAPVEVLAEGGTAVGEVVSLALPQGPGSQCRRATIVEPEARWVTGADGTDAVEGKGGGG